MDKYYNLIHEASDQYMFIDNFEIEPNTFLEENMWKGEKIDFFPKIFNLFVKPRKKIPDLLFGYGLSSSLIVSEKFLEILQGFSNELESFSVNLFDMKGKEMGCDFFYINILDNVNVFDWKNSYYNAYSKLGNGEYVNWDNNKYNKYKNVEPIIDTVEKLKFCGTELEERHVFRVEGIENYIFVDEELKQKIKNNNLKNIIFKPISEFVIS